MLGFRKIQKTEVVVAMVCLKVCSLVACRKLKIHFSRFDTLQLQLEESRFQ